MDESIERIIRQALYGARKKGLDDLKQPLLDYYEAGRLDELPLHEPET